MVELKYIGKKAFVFKNKHLKQIETEYIPRQWIKMPKSDADWMMKYNGNIFKGIRDFVPVEKILDVPEEEAAPVEPEYVCGICGKKYTSEYFYNKHMAKHLTEAIEVED